MCSAAPSNTAFMLRRGGGRLIRLVLLQASPQANTSGETSVPVAAAVLSTTPMSGLSCQLAPSQGIWLGSRTNDKGAGSPRVSCQVGIHACVKLRRLSRRSITLFVSFPEYSIYTARRAHRVFRFELLNAPKRRNGLYPKS